MAEERAGGTPSEPPTPKRLRDARLRGEVARSRELTSTVVFMAAAGALSWLWPDILLRLRALLEIGVRSAPAGEMDAAAALALGQRVLLLACLPVAGAALAGALAGGYLQVGTLFTLAPLKPRLRRLDPLANARRIFGKAALFELLKALIKIGGIGYLAVDALLTHAPQLLATAGQPAPRALAVVTACAADIALRVLVAMAALSLADLLYQRHAHRRRLRMTRLEVQRESKEQEGDPQHKAERRRLHREVLEHQMLEAVAGASCVVINPDHIAVALRYDPETMNAPKVIARGQRLLAARIREIARQHGVPIVRNVPLARALLELEIDDEVPPELYEAVAEVLRFVERIIAPSPGRRV